MDFGWPRGEDVPNACEKHDMDNVNRYVLVVMGVVGWITAGVLGTLCGLMSSGGFFAWNLLVALAVGLIWAAVPVLILVFVALRAFGGLPSPDKSSLPAAEEHRTDELPVALGHSHRVGNSVAPFRVRVVALAVLGAVEMLALPLSIVAAMHDDDSLLLSVPFQGILIVAGVLAVFAPSWQRVSRALCGIHLIGLAIAMVAAAIDIESVVMSGVLLTISGIALAWVGKSPHTVRVLFGASTVAFIVVSFLIIALGNVGPNEADEPLFTAIVVYQLLAFPVGLRLFHPGSRDAGLTSRPKYGIRHLLILMTWAGIAVGIARIVYSLDDDIQIAIAAGLAGLEVLGICTVMIAGYRARAAQQAIPLDGHAVVILEGAGTIDPRDRKL
jgi:hypothetical protein